uniref:Uncharacterized protein n=1 Tax=Wenling levi-like virus 3 TaxID=1923499 RepID=A0A1L3KIQ8_9VIRU|nr:hypothetical protein [Wenling levi-like virus 3]
MRTRSTGSPEYATVLKPGTQTSFHYRTKLRPRSLSTWERYFGFPYPGYRDRYGNARASEFAELTLKHHESMAQTRVLNRLKELGGVMATVVVKDDATSVSDVVTPNFKRKMAAGQIINNKFSKISRSVMYGISPARGEPSVEVVSYSQTWTGTGSRKGLMTDLRANVSNVVPGAGVTKGFNAYLKSKAFDVSLDSGQNALSQANSNLRSADLDAIVSAAEISSTLRTIVKGGTQVASIVKSIKRGRFFKTAPKAWRKYKKALKQGRAVKPQDFASDAWLEARYAWRPIMYDVNGALKVINGDVPASKRITFRGFDSSSTNETLTIDYTDDATGLHYRGELDRSVTTTSRAGIIGDARLQSSYAKSLGLFNVVDAGWDLIPYSFVINWFIDVSWIISKLNPTVAYIPRASWVTNTSQVVVSGELEVTTSNGTKTSLPIAMTSEQKIRTPNPKPQIIRINLNLDFLKAIDLVALFRGR